MTARAGNWLIALGAITIFLGLCFMPAALGEHRDQTLLAMGAAVFAMGALLAAAGVYIKAQVLQSQSSTTDAEATPTRRSRGGCELCGSDVPVIHCRVHQLHLCSTCLAEHYDARSCSYVPPTRRPAGKANKSIAKARGA
jgi:uncharacterized membrane protein